MTTISSFGEEQLRVDVPAATPARRKRTMDYRLRGLDLDAPALADRPDEQPRLHRGLRRRRWRFAAKAVVTVAVGVGVAVALRGAVVQPYRVTSTSMMPTLRPDTDVLVVTSRTLAGIDVGDIVVLRQPAGLRCDAGRGDLVKRVVAGPGDTIWSFEDRIFVNGSLLDRPEWHNPPYGELAGTEIAPVTLGPDSYYVLGDNRTNVCDSRSFGAVPASLVVGEVVMTLAHGGHPSVHSI